MAIGGTGAAGTTAGYKPVLPGWDNAAVLEGYYVSLERYLRLLDELAGAARAFDPPPDSIIAVIRSGLTPGMYLSHQLHLPLFTSADAAKLPCPRLCRPLIVDTTCWSGGKLRAVAAKLVRVGAAPEMLVMFARAKPLPPVDGLNYLYTSARIPRFWYEVPHGALELFEPARTENLD